MNFLINLITKHLWAAIVQNWGTTLFGVLAALMAAWPNLESYFHGDFSKTDWRGLGSAAMAIVLGALSKTALNWKSLLFGLGESAPKAEPVKKA